MFDINQLYPEYSEAYYWRGVAKNYLSNYRGAMHDIKKAIKLNPGHVNNCGKIPYDFLLDKQDLINTNIKNSLRLSLNDLIEGCHGNSWKSPMNIKITLPFLSNGEVIKNYKISKTNSDLLEISRNKNERLGRISAYKPEIVHLGKKIIEHREKILPSNRATLEIPKDFMKKLATGQARRTEAVIRGDKGRILKHLKDINPTKATKALKTAALLAFVAIDIAEQALLNEKLNHILAIVKNVDSESFIEFINDPTLILHAKKQIFKAIQVTWTVNEDQIDNAHRIVFK